MTFKFHENEKKNKNRNSYDFCKSVRGIIDDCGFTSTMEMIDVNCNCIFIRIQTAYRITKADMVQFVEYMTECVNMDEQKKMMELRDILTEIEEKRENGIETGCTLDELDSYLEEILAE